MVGGGRSWAQANPHTDPLNLDPAVREGFEHFYNLDYDGAPQRLEIVALDGVATNSQDGARMGRPIYANHILLGPTNRAEFIVTAPAPNFFFYVMATY